jgi:hypothetical protein
MKYPYYYLYRKGNMMSLLILSYENHGLIAMYSLLLILTSLAFWASQWTCHQQLHGKVTWVSSKVGFLSSANSHMTRLLPGNRSYASWTLKRLPPQQTRLYPSKQSWTRITHLRSPRPLIHWNYGNCVSSQRERRIEAGREREMKIVINMKE